jgi:4-oxalocrotonate tautomerase
MPLVHVHMAAGRSDDQKRALMTAMTDAMVEHLGAPRESVRVWINEFPSTDFMAGGELLADKHARLAREAAATRRPDDADPHPVPGQ